MKKICIYLIEWYQKHISKFFVAKNIRCKYYPTCSEYTKQAIEKYGNTDEIRYDYSIVPQWIKQKLAL